VFGEDNPPHNADVAFGGAIPVVIHGLPYGTKNLYAEGAPPGLPETGPPGDVGQKFLIQRSNAAFASQERKGPSLGKVVMGIQEGSDTLIVAAEEQGASPGLNLSEIRDKFTQWGVRNALAWDGSDSATLVRDDTVVVHPSERKNTKIPVGLGFRQ
jgi:hypothetical protein